MLNDKDAVATVAVKNLETARKFYEDTLGLPKVMENEEVLTFKTGKSMLFVYRSHTPAPTRRRRPRGSPKRSIRLVRTLKGRGVNFEHYDLPNMTRQGDVHVAGTMRVAWFKDPDGNIFSIVTPADKASRETVGASAQSRA